MIGIPSRPPEALQQPDLLVVHGIECRRRGTTWRGYRDDFEITLWRGPTTEHRGSQVGWHVLISNNGAKGMSDARDLGEAATRAVRDGQQDIARRAAQWRDLACTR
jgi:hypothetical protein